MAKSEQRLKAREMRKKGISVCVIAKELGVAKSTTSLWVRDIIMTIEQLEELKKHSILGSERARLANALRQKKEESDFKKIWKTKG